MIRLESSADFVCYEAMPGHIFYTITHRCGDYRARELLSGDGWIICREVDIEERVTAPGHMDVHSVTSEHTYARTEDAAIEKLLRLAARQK